MNVETAQEATSRQNIPLQEKFHRGFPKGVRNISDTPSNTGMKFLLGRAKWGIYRLLRDGGVSEDARGQGQQGGSVGVVH